MRFPCMKISWNKMKTRLSTKLCQKLVTLASALYSHISGKKSIILQGKRAPDSRVFIIPMLCRHWNKDFSLQWLVKPCLYLQVCYQRRFQTNSKVQVTIYRFESTFSRRKVEKSLNWGLSTASEKHHTSCLHFWCSALSSQATAWGHLQREDLDDSLQRGPRSQTALQNYKWKNCDRMQSWHWLSGLAATLVRFYSLNWINTSGHRYNSIPS